MQSRITFLAVMLAISSPAAAHTADPAVRQIAVSYADLDLTTLAGIAELKARVRLAAKEVCPRDPGRGDAIGHAIATSCISETSVRSGKRITIAINSMHAASPYLASAAR